MARLAVANLRGQETQAPAGSHLVKALQHYAWEDRAGSHSQETSTRGQVCHHPHCQLLSTGGTALSSGLVPFLGLNWEKRRCQGGLLFWVITPPGPAERWKTQAPSWVCRVGAPGSPLSPPEGITPPPIALPSVPPVILL